MDVLRHGIRRFACQIGVTVLVAALGLTLRAAPALGATLRMNKTRSATTIVQGQVLRVKSFWNRAHTLIYSTIKIRVDRTIKGRAPRHFSLTLPGGTVGSLSLKVSDQPEFRRGERVRLYLTKSHGRFRLLGGADAKATPSSRSPRAVPGDPTPGYKYNGVRWRSSALPMPYWISFDFTANENTAIQKAFATWQDDPGSAMRYDYRGQTSRGAPIRDDCNAVIKKNEGSGGNLATCWWWYDSSKYLLEADIIFNTYYVWGTDGSPEKYDLQGVATHEVGHTVNLADLYSSADLYETMYGYTEKGETYERTLCWGDEKGVALVYPGPPSPVENVVSGDFNGDGKSDANVFWDREPEVAGCDDYVMKANAAGTDFLYQDLWWRNNVWDWNSTKIIGGDFNGDQKEDIAVLANMGGGSTLYVLKANASGTDFLPEDEWWRGDTFNWNRSALTSGDYNGDGKDDVCIFYNGQPGWVAYVLKANSAGTDFVPEELWSQSPVNDWNMHKVTSGDYNGDGKDDLGVVWDSGFHWPRTQADVYAANTAGTGFDEAGSWWWAQWDLARIKVESGDYNGDGKDDLCLLWDREPGCIEYVLQAEPTGPGFVAADEWWRANTWEWNRTKFTSGDYNGDGKDDVSILWNRNTGCINYVMKANASGTDFDPTEGGDAWWRADTWDWNRTR